MTVPKHHMRLQRLHIDLILLVVLLVLCNLHLLSNASSDATAFFTARVFDGEWWRIVTHMFTHVSWYHFIIDASAFFLIYYCLAEQSWWRRLLYVTACSLGSLAGAFFSPQFYSLGLCGLSGTAHGLMAVVALELITGRDRPNRIVGWIVLVALVGKTSIELYTGQAFFSALHFGTIGTPIVQCHAGGIAGGALLFAFLHCLTIFHKKMNLSPDNSNGLYAKNSTPGQSLPPNDCHSPQSH